MLRVGELVLLGMVFGAVLYGLIMFAVNKAVRGALNEKKESKKDGK
jgi:hypothetical protein